GTGEIDPKIVWGIEQSSHQLAALMPDMNIAHHCALAVPGKFRVRTQKRNPLVGKPVQHRVPDCLPARLALTEPRRSRNLETWWCQKIDVGDEMRESNAFKERAEIQT